jgi:predicted dehydrogenase
MGPFNRREFLQQSAAISAAMAALSPSDFLRAAPQQAAARAVGPNDTLRVAVVGVHGRGMSHVGDDKSPAFNGANGCEIVTICDCDQAVIGNAMKKVEAKRGKAPKYVQDIRKVLEDKDVDIVTIATPNHWHSLAAIWALQAGKQVYVEKPVSHNVHEGRIIVETAHKLGRICQTGTQSRSTKGMRDAMAYIHSGNIGKVKLSYGTCYKRRGSIGKVAGEQAIPESIDYDLWCGPAPKLPLMRKKLHYDWHWVWAYGNGDLGNQGIHEMDKARWGLGKNEMPKSVMSVGGRFGYVDDGETANTQLCLFDYGDAELIFEVRGLESENPYPGAVVGGAKGTQFTGNIFYGDKGIVVCPSYSGGVALDPDLKVVSKFGGGSENSHFGNFVKAVRANDRKLLNAEIEEGHLSSALCHLGNISYRLGVEKPMSEVNEITNNKDAQEAFTRMLKHLTDNKVDVAKAIGRVGPLLPIDPKTERFTGNNTKANEMLFAEYRKGFEVPEKV